MPESGNHRAVPTRLEHATHVAAARRSVAHHAATPGGRIPLAPSPAEAAM
ncbi:MAG: hypothetical protein HY736_19250 [Verrucomicrobia bacterium]|nr:hypothetical protein [Verrucomicrobiota bacterium]